MEGMSRKVFDAVNDSRDRVASWPTTWFFRAAGSPLPIGPSPASPRLETDNRPSKPITDMIAAGRFICQGPFPYFQLIKHNAQESRSPPLTPNERRRPLSG